MDRYSDFLGFSLAAGFTWEGNSAGAALRVRTWCDTDLALEAGASHFGMVTRGNPELREPGHPRWLLEPASYFLAPGPGRLAGRDSAGLLVSVAGYRGLRQFGGPVGGPGRLQYIDGCSDTLLIAPPVWGEPCLNQLHIPPGVRQTPHTHPSVRLGVVLWGAGRCRTRDGVHELSPGLGWCIPEGCVHAFETDSESLEILAWHPDSDFGPTDAVHPMRNRTILAGEAAPEPQG